MRMKRKELVQAWHQLAHWSLVNQRGQEESFQEIKLRRTLKTLHLQAEAAFLIGSIELKIVQNNLHTTTAISQAILQVLHEQGYVIEAEEYKDQQRFQQYKLA